LANDKIYTKQVNLDGTSSIKVYELTNIPLEPTVASSQEHLVTKKEFSETINNLLVEISNLKTLVPTEPEVKPAQSFNF
jgi:hypothetical protein